jgi:hypothetical protein
MKCPRQPEDPNGVFKTTNFVFLNKPDDGTCDQCGSLLGDTLMARLEKGDVILGPTDKNYKVYVRNKGGECFKQTHRIDNSREHNLDGSPDQTKWVWQTNDSQECKFYFQHLTDEQKKRFVELLNDKKIKFDQPGYFYVLPFFIKNEK